MVNLTFLGVRPKPITIYDIDEIFVNILSNLPLFKFFTRYFKPSNFNPVNEFYFAKFLDCAIELSDNCSKLPVLATLINAVGSRIINNKTEPGESQMSDFDLKNLQEFLSALCVTLKKRSDDKSYDLVAAERLVKNLLIERLVYQPYDNEISVLLNPANKRDDLSVAKLIANKSKLFDELNDYVVDSKSWSSHTKSLVQMHKNPARREFLVDDVIVKGEFGIIGGPMKSGKTTIAVDLAMSLATGTPFLNYPAFKSKKCNVLIVSVESGEPVIYEYMMNALKLRGLSVEDASIHANYELPNLGNPSAVNELEQQIKDLNIDVLILDPLYTAFTGGDTPLKPEDMFSLFASLELVITMCKANKVTPIVCHHAALRGTGHDGPIGLEHLAYPAIAMMVRQWLLINAAEAYDTETGTLTSYLNIGGSSGHGSKYVVSLRLGVFGASVNSRTLIPNVTPYLDYKLQIKDEKLTAKALDYAAKFKERADKIMAVLQASDIPLAPNKIHEITKFKTDTIKPVLDKLINQQLVFRTCIPSKKDGAPPRYVYGATSNQKQMISVQKELTDAR